MCGFHKVKKKASWSPPSALVSTVGRKYSGLNNCGYSPEPRTTPQSRRIYQAAHCQQFLIWTPLTQHCDGIPDCPLVQIQIQCLWMQIRCCRYRYNVADRDSVLPIQCCWYRARQSHSLDCRKTVRGERWTSQQLSCSSFWQVDVKVGRTGTMVSDCHLHSSAIIKSRHGGYSLRLFLNHHLPER